MFSRFALNTVLVSSCFVLAFAMGCGQSKEQAVDYSDKVKSKSNTPDPYFPPQAAVEPEPPTEKLTAKDGPGTYREYFYLSDGEKASYTMLIPETYSADKPIPLIFVLHNGGGINGGPFYGSYILSRLVEPALGDLGAIIVAPDSGKSGWGSKRNHESVDSLIRWLTEAYSIDEKRTLVTGYSMGGHGTWSIAEKQEEFFAVAIPMAGSPQTKKTDWKTSFYVIHSYDDEIVDIGKTAKFVETLKENDVNVETNFVNGYGHYEMPSYVEPMKKAIPFIRAAWSKK